MAQDMKIKYAKEFFVTEKGEVVKMAGIITQDPKIQQELFDQRERDPFGRTLRQSEKQQTSAEEIQV